MEDCKGLIWVDAGCQYMVEYGSMGRLKESMSFSTYPMNLTSLLTGEDVHSE